MNIAIRADGGPEIGLGHIRRCLTLAQALRQQHAWVGFITNYERTGLERMGLPDIKVARVSPARDLEQTRAALEHWAATAVIIDSYCIDSAYLMALRQDSRLIIVIDDLADRYLPVNVVVNGAIHARQFHYHTLPQTRMLLGPAYTLLRPEFAQTPARQFHPDIERVLITVGGSDPADLTSRLVTWTRQALGEVSLDVVIGPFFTATAGGCLDRPGVTLHHNPANMRALMLAADLAISGGGQTTYELAATGTPAIAICLANNQQGSLSELARAGTLISAGDITAADLQDRVILALSGLAANAAQRAEMNVRGRQLVDGLGARRVAEAIITISKDLSQKVEPLDREHYNGQN